MSERKVLNKYYPPDFDPSKIKRRKGINKDAQITIRLMAPFSMRCNRCGEYIYKGKKFNARKETATTEEYYGIKIFRFYIKCPMCSSEITFKTDPKNADYICEQGATRNFENWSEADSKRLQALPDAAADEDYDSEGNPLEEKKERDAMADLERSQEQSRREMEMMDELADLRQRNARLEQSGVTADPDALLAALHAERESVEEEARRLADQEEDDALVAQYFSKIAAGPRTNGTANTNGNDADADADGNSASDADDSEEEDVALPALTIKRKIAPVGNGRVAEPTVASILAAKGKVLEANGAAASGSSGISGAVAAGQAAAKRKREGMQKLLGIKKKK
ncbi:hypothetical protein EHS25_008092 [Saitozyma podzolica]|uniref:Splicing factor YJU2 n=1 Tax=Saitozyma podzolica TaxID=1890683 RepID=A0A427YNL2_9TREE|nr:hypothetical protein EHS25_008092 [Saitozyma podzolica]